MIDYGSLCWQHGEAPSARPLRPIVHIEQSAPKISSNQLPRYCFSLGVVASAWSLRARTTAAR